MGAVPADLEELARIPLFEDLEPSVLTAATRQAKVSSLPARESLFKEGEKPEFLHLLLSGSVVLSAAMPEEGKETIIEIVPPHHSFILAAVLTDTPYLMSARLLEPARILLLPAAELRRSIARYPDLALRLLVALASQSRRMVRQLKNLKLRSTVQRLGFFLLSLAQPGPEGTASVQLPYDKQLIASHLGMTRESLSRALAALRDFGVETQNDRILLKDPASLERFCGSNSLTDEEEIGLRLPP